MSLQGGEFQKILTGGIHMMSCARASISFCPHRYFVIYLSTSSNIRQLAPSGPLAGSARARDNADALQAPVTEIPFDCSPIFPIIPGKLGLDDVCKIEFMAQFGRPM